MEMNFYYFKKYAWFINRIKYIKNAFFINLNFLKLILLN